MKIKNQHIKGIFYIVLAAVGFSLMSMFVRLSGDLPTMEKAFFRNAVPLAISIYLLSRTPEKFKVRRDSWLNLILRSAFGTAGLISNFWAIDQLGIADANVLNKLSPRIPVRASASIAIAHTYEKCSTRYLRA